MRCVDLMLRGARLGWLAVAATGCALLADPPAPAPQEPVPAATAPPAAAAPPATDASASTAKTEAEPPVSPAVQQAFERARQALIAGRMEEAERGFLALTKSHPELGGPHANLAIVYRRAGKLAEATAALERAVQANPKQPTYFNQLGIVYRMAGQFTKAREAYDQAIALDPNYALAYLNLGILYDVYLWDSKRALDLYDRYLALSPNGDDKVKKWISDIKNRNPQRSLASRKEQG